MLLASAAPWAAAEGGQVVRKGKWECHFSSLFFLLDGGNGCAGGTILPTPDGGVSWTSLSSGSSDCLRSAHLCG